MTSPITTPGTHDDDAKRAPADADKKLDKSLKETFPASDPTPPGKGIDPPPDEKKA